ncbi:LysR family transcriptional regulator [Roseibium sediminicola]|uniref:LysR family transcriptional regulator n=1 Tax=Roseibium sediminicola TaxID=2933272 RepID=A0ABT0GNF8_9HYPH|nr:LysR family transcriptional regulator [Roseibium sp. CAU 1639]MCK7610953.1 LysR family transcriptional regulator [Roseibium sp. CAU 1639]
MVMKPASDRPDIPLSIARALDLIGTTGSVSEAAKRLGVTQPAISKGIAQLEARFGVNLVRRGSRPLTLTEEGEALARYARQEDLARQVTLGALEDARHNRSGTVRLGSFGSSASFHILPKTLAAFAGKYPGIAVEVLEFPDEELRKALEDGIVDMAILSVEQEENLEIVPITSDKLVALVPLTDPLGGKSLLTAPDLAGRPFILTKGGSGPLVERWFAQAGVAPNIAHTILQVNSIVALVQAGLGVSIMAELALPDVSGKCRVLPLDPVAPRVIGWARTGKTFKSNAAETFWKFCGRFTP